MPDNQTHVPRSDEGSDIQAMMAASGHTETDSIKILDALDRAGWVLRPHPHNQHQGTQIDRSRGNAAENLEITLTGRILTHENEACPFLAADVVMDGDIIVRRRLDVHGRRAAALGQRPSSEHGGYIVGYIVQNGRGQRLKNWRDLFLTGGNRYPRQSDIGVAEKIVLEKIHLLQGRKAQRVKGGWLIAGDLMGKGNA